MRPDFAAAFHSRRDRTLRLVNGIESAQAAPPPERANPTAGTNSRLDRNWGQRHMARQMLVGARVGSAPSVYTS